MKEELALAIMEDLRIQRNGAQDKLEKAEAVLINILRNFDCGYEVDHLIELYFAKKG